MLLIQLFVMIFSASSKVDEMFKNPIGFRLALLLHSVVLSRAEKCAGGAIQREGGIPGIVQ